jgi:hypothetical protein
MTGPVADSGWISFVPHIPLASPLYSCSRLIPAAFDAAVSFQGQKIDFSLLPNSNIQITWKLQQITDLVVK